MSADPALVERARLLAKDLVGANLDESGMADAAANAILTDAMADPAVCLIVLGFLTGLASSALVLTEVASGQDRYALLELLAGS